MLISPERKNKHIWAFFAPSVLCKMTNKNHCNQSLSVGKSLMLKASLIILSSSYSFQQKLAAASNLYNAKCDLQLGKGRHLDSCGHNGL